MKIFPLWLIAFCSVPFLAFGQGSLTPPPGAPGPTMKTLDQVEARTPLSPPIAPATLPIIISSGGSYYLTGNVTAPSGYTGNGITVNSNVSNVTIDLNGFTLTGVSGSGAGVFIGNGNVTIRNGTVRNWSKYGIDGTLVSNVRVEDIRAISNALAGIAIDVNGVVSHCVADSNSGRGIYVSGSTAKGSLITQCQTNATSGSPGAGFDVGIASVMTDCVSNGDVIGFQMATDCQLSNCRVMNPTGSGASGFAFGNGCTFDRCAATLSNSSRGFNGFHSPTTDESANCVFRACSVFVAPGNTATASGFLAGAGSIFQNCNVTGSHASFEIFKNPSDFSGTNASFTNCTVTGGSFDTGEGCTFSNCSVVQGIFTTTDGSTFLGCSATGGGFQVGDGCTVSNCTATTNTGHGFQFGNGCLLNANTARNNTQDGFHGTGTRNRIDGNLAVSNSGTGIHSSTVTADQIIRNTSIGNVTNYDAGLGTNAGPTGAPPATSTSPWANF
jgi:Right handed beta helix region